MRRYRLTPQVRALLVCALGAAAATCREPATGPGGRPAQLALNPVLPSATQLAAFGIAADTLRVIVVRPTADTVADARYYFSPDSSTLAVTVSLDLIANTEDLDVTVELRGGGVALFSGTQTLTVNAGPNPPGPAIALSYVGPGTTVDTLKVTPLDSVITLNDSLRYQVSAVDALGNPVTQFFVSWTTSDTTVARANGSGVVRAPGARGAVYVIARTPNGRRDSTRVTFIPVPTAVTAVSGMGQSGPPGTLLPLPLVARVTGADALGVKGIAVHFSAPPNGSVTTPTVVTDSLGFAQTIATLGTTPGGGNFQASVTGIATPAAFPATVVGATATQLVFTAQPAISAVAGTSLGGVTIELRDAQNQLVTGAANQVSIALGANPGAATLGGTTSAIPVNGVATFNNLSLTKVAAGYTLVATASGLTPDTSGTVAITPAAPSQLAFTGQPGNIIAGAAFASNIVVEIRDLFGNLTAATNAVTLGITPGTATLLGSTTVAAVGGVATFSGVSVDKAAVNYTLNASAASLTGATSQTFDVAPAGATQLAVTSFPATVISGQAFTAPVIVQAQDSFGNLAPSFAGQVAIALGANPNGGTLTGALTAAAVAGTANFPGLQIDNPGPGYTLVATAAGLTADTSGAITVAPPTAGRYWIAAAGGLWSNPANWSGGLVPGATDTVFITLGGSYTVTLDVNDTIAFLTLGGATGTQTLAANGRTLGIDSAATILPTATVSLTNSALTMSATGVLLDLGTIAVAPGSSAINGGLVLSGGSLLRLNGNNGYATLAVTTAVGLTNLGTIELTGTGWGGQLTVTGGPLVNAPGGTLHTLNGSGNTFTGVLDNQGAVQVDGPFSLATATAAHTNSGTLTLGTGDLSLAMSGPGSFTTSGNVVVGAGRTLVVNGGTFNYANATPGGLGGPGAITFTSTVLNLTPDLVQDTLTLSFSSAVVNGPGTLTVGPGRTLTLLNTTVNAALINQGTVQVPPGSNAVNGPYTNPVGSLLRLNGNNGYATLTIDSTVTNQGTIELTGTGWGGQLTVTGGPLVNAPGGILHTLNGSGNSLTGVLDNQGTVQVDGPLTFPTSTAQHTNSGTLTLGTADLSLNMSGPGSFTTTGSVAVNAGRTFAVNGGTFNYANATPGGLGGPGAITFTSTVLNLTPDLVQDTLTLSFSSAVVNGPGTLTVGPGRTLTLLNTTVNAALVNQGTVQVPPGTNVVTGAFTNPVGALLRLNGNNGYAILSIDSTVTNQGTIELTGTGWGGQLTVTGGPLVNAPGGTLHTLNGSGNAIIGTLDNQGAVQLDGPLSFPASTAQHTNSGTVTLAADLSLNMTGIGSFTTTGSVVIGAGRTLTVNGGTFNYASAAVGGLGGPGAVNFTSTVLNLTPDLLQDTLTLGFSSTVVNGPGTLTVGPGRTLTLVNTTVNAALVNQGTVQVPPGTNFLNGAFTAPTGSLLRLNGNNGYATLSIDSAVTNQGTIELTGTGWGGQLTVTGGPLVNAPGGTLHTLNGSGNSFTGVLDNQGAVQVDGPLSFPSSTALHTNSGTLTLGAADLTLSMSGAGSFTTTGSVVVGSGRTLTVNGGTFNYANAAPGGLGGLGAIAFTSTTLNLSPDLLQDTLTVSLSNAIVNGPGTLTVGPGRTLTLVNTTVNAALINQGTVQVPPGTNFLNGAFTNGVGALLRLNGNNGYAFLTIDSTVTNQGTIELTGTGWGGQLTVTGGPLVNAPGGTLHTLNGSGNAFTGVLDNQGAVQLDGLLTLNGASANHVNGGTIVVNQNLTIAQSGPATFANDGIFEIGTGRTATVTGGTFTNDAAGTLRGSGTLNVSGTSFSNAGAVNPGTSPGILTITGPFPAAPGSVVNVELGGLTAGTQYDRLAVSGAAALDGILNVTLSGGFVPTVTDQFTIMTYGSQTGAFSQMILPPGMTASIGPTSIVLTQATVGAAGTVSWAAGVSGNWSNAANWTGGSVPSNLDTVLIDAPGSYTVTLDVDAAIGRLVLGGGSGTQTLSGNARTLTLGNGGTIAASGALALTGNSTIAGAGTLTNQGTLDMAGVISVPVDNLGSLTVPGGGTSQITGALTQSGTLRVNGNNGPAALTVATGFTNQGLVDLTGTSWGGQLTVTSGALINAGGASFQSMNGTGNTYVGLFTNQGSVSVSGPLTFSNAGHTLDGTTGSFSIGGSLTLTIDGGTVLVGSGTALFGTGTISLSGTDTLSLASDLTLTPTTPQWSFPGTVTVNGPGQLINQTTLVLTNDVVNAPLDNQAGATLELPGGSTSHINGALTQAGTLRVNGNNGPAVLTVATGFTNQGLVELTGTSWGGQLTVTSGALTNAAGATFQSVSGTGNSYTGLFAPQGTVAVSGPLTLNNAGQTLDATAATLNVAGGQTLTVNGGTLVVGSGTGLVGTGTISLPGTQTLSLASDVTFTPTTPQWAFPGTVTVDGPGQLINQTTLFLTNDVVNAPLDNQAGATLELPGGSTSQINSALTQAGTLRLNGNNGPAALTVATGFTNQGLLELTGTSWGGQLTVASGSLINAAGATFQSVNGIGNSYTGLIAPQGTVAVSGPLTFNNAGQTLDATAATLNVAGGQTLTVTGGTLVVGSGTGLVGTGTISLSGTDTLSLASDVTLTPTTPQWDLLGAVTVNGPGQLINQTTLFLTNDVVNAALDNQNGATLELPGGSTSQITGALTQAGTLRLNGNNGPAVLTVATGFTNQGLLELTGTSWGGQLTVTSGALINAAGATFQSVSGTGNSYTGLFAPQGTVAVSGPLTFNNAGQTLDATAATLNVASGQTLTVSGGTLVVGSGTGLVGTGTISLPGTQTLSLASDLTLTPTTPQWSFPGTVTVNGPGQLINQTTLFLTNDVVNAPLDNQAGATLELPGGSTSQITGALTQSGTLRVNGDNGPAALTVATGFTNQGLLELTGTSWGGQLTVTSGALTNAVGATFKVTSGVGNTLTAPVSNQGTLTLDQTLTLNAASAQHANTGLISALNGDFTITQSGATPSFANDGVLEVGAAHTVKVTGGTFTNGVSGTLRGNGTLDFAATLFANDGSVGPGTSPGVLTLTGPFPATPTSQLNIELGGPTAGADYDRLDVSGAANLDGIVNVSLINGFTPAVNDQFTIMTYGSQAGAFSQLILPPGMTLIINPTSVVLTQATVAAGASISWIAGSGNWSTAANWSTGTVPTSADTAVIALPGTYTVTLDVDATVGKLRVGAGVGAAGTQTLSGTGRILTVGPGSTVDAKGALTLTGASTLTGSGTLANIGALTLTGSTSNLAVDNQGLLAVTSAMLNGQVTTGGADTIRVGAGGAGTVTFAKGFTVNGRLQYRIASGTNTLAITQGPLVIAPAGRMDVVPVGGAGGTLTAMLDNQGLVSLGAGLTINGAAAAHSNTGTIDLTGGNLTVQQSGAGAGLTNAGTILVPANRNFAVNSGTYTQTATGLLSGAGTASLTALTAADFASAIGVSRVTIDGVPTTLAVSQALGGRWSITNATLSGPVTWTVGPTDTLDFTGGTVNITLQNQGLVRAVGVFGFNGVLGTTAGSTVRLGLIPGSATSGGTFTFATGFTNNGSLQLQTVSASTTTLVLTTGTLVNAAGATLSSDPTGTGIRRITAPIDNQGTLSVIQSLTLNQAAGVHTNSGTIDVADGQSLLVGNGGSLALAGAGKAQGAGTLDVSGPLTAVAGTSMAVDSLRVGNTLTVSGTFSPATTVFTGAAQNIPVLAYANVSVIPSSGTAKFLGTTTVTGDLVKAGAGTTRLDLNGQFVNVTGNLSVLGGAVLWSLPASIMNVAGNATFQGAGTSGLMTAGTLRVAGNFTQVGTAGGGSDASFKPTLSHLTILNGAAPQTVTFQTPGSITLSSQFANLQIANTSSGGVTLASNAYVATQLLSPGSGARPVSGFFRVAGGGKTLTAKGLDADSLFLDNTPLVVDSGGTITSFNAVRFQNYAPTGIAFDLTGTAGQVTFNNLAFLTPPTTGFHLRVNDPVIGNGRFTVNLNAPTPTAAGGAQFTTTGEGLINWP